MMSEFRLDLVPMIDIRDYNDLVEEHRFKIGACAIYAVSAEITNRIKIGISENIRSRFSGLQTDSPDQLTLEFILWCPDKNMARAIEEACHKSFAERNSHGEWFNVSLQDAIRVIEDLSINLYPKKVFYTHGAFVEKAKRLVLATCQKRRSQRIDREVPISRALHALGYDIRRSRYLQNARI